MSVRGGQPPPCLCARPTPAGRQGRCSALPTAEQAGPPTARGGSGARFHGRVQAGGRPPGRGGAGFEVQGSCAQGPLPGGRMLGLEGPTAGALFYARRAFVASGWIESPGELRRPGSKGGRSAVFPFSRLFCCSRIERQCVLFRRAALTAPSGRNTALLQPLIWLADRSCACRHVTGDPSWAKVSNLVRHTGRSDPRPWRIPV